MLSNRSSDAIVQYQFALERNPYAIEAVEQLAVLGVSEQRILELVEVGVQCFAKERIEEIQRRREN